MRNRDIPTNFNDIVTIWIILLVILISLILIIVLIHKEHENILETSKVLQHEIAELREALKAHDEKPEWFERKEFKWTLNQNQLLVV